MHWPDKEVGRFSGARQQEGMARQLGDILWLQKNCSWGGVAVLPGTIDRTRTP